MNIQTQLIVISLLLTSSICESQENQTFDIANYTFYYKLHHYEVNHSAIIDSPYNKAIIDDDNILITTSNSTSLSFIINNYLQLSFFNNTNFHEISHKYNIYSLSKRRMTDDPPFQKGSVAKDASGKSLNIECPNGIIKISEASYGMNCKPDNHNNQLNTLKAQCDGKKTCAYTIDHAKIGDPAPGCQKTYDYQYQCNNDIHQQYTQHLTSHMDQHRKEIGQHLSGLKDQLLEEMKKGFDENNKKTVLLRKIEELKHQQTQLQLEHDLLKSRKEQKTELDKEKNRIMQQQMEWEQKRAMERQKYIDKKKKMVQQRHEMRLNEHYELMNGLKTFLMSFNKLLKPNDKVGEDKKDIGKNDGSTPNRYETRYTKYAGFNGAPPLLPPMPPLPPGIMEEENFLDRKKHPRLLMESDVGFEGIDKCIYGVFGEICIGYNVERDIISFDVMLLVKKEMKWHRNGIDINMDNSNDLFDPMQWNVAYDIWKHGDKERMEKYDDYVHHFVVYKYEFRMDNRNLCMDKNDNLPFSVCFKMNDNEDIVIYFEELTQFKQFEVEWGDDEQWNEIITFDTRINYVRKCVNLVIAKLCVDSYDEYRYTVELKMHLINELV